MMKDFDEKTIWTSDIVPLMASYHKGTIFSIFWSLHFPLFCGLKWKLIFHVAGKFQHSVWQIDGTTYQEEINDNAVPPIPCDISMHKFAFRKIWQGKCSQSAASKVCSIPTSWKELFFLSYFPFSIYGHIFQCCIACFLIDSLDKVTRFLCC